MIKQYPIGIQNFSEIRNGGYVYVDKTKLIHKLFTTGKYYFLGRPRRFGKSLLLSTIEAYAQGRKELFKGLALEMLEQKWESHTVLHLDLNARDYKDETSLYSILDRHLSKWEEEYMITIKSDSLVEDRFMEVIRRAFETTGRQVVILVDEYDKPLLQAIGNETLQNKYRDTLKAFYGLLKSMDSYIKFAMLTGVTKFGKVSVFSDLNNLRDISMSESYVQICGITEQEIRDNFEEDVRNLAAHNGISYDRTCEILRENYDGYHFEHDTVGIYNPFSLLNTFADQKFSNYWFATGTPTYLVELLKRHKYDLSDMEETSISADTLNCIDSTSADPIPVIYQSGYLTIKGYEERFGLYELGFPNREVKQGFLEFLLPYYANVKETRSVFEISRFVNEVESGNPDAFFSRMQTFFADCPYELASDLEIHYQNVLYIVFKLMGFYVEVEYHTNRGRVDLVLKTKDYIYVMEFKLDGTAEQALQQIKEKGYAEPFHTDNRKILLVGANFSSETRNVDKWVVEYYMPYSKKC